MTRAPVRRKRIATMTDQAPAPVLFDPEATWPDLFAPLDAKGRRAIVNALTAGWHEGWEPTREEVADLIAEATGEINEAEFMRRVDARAARVG